MSSTYSKNWIFKFIEAYWFEHIETACLLSNFSKAKNHISVKADMDEIDVTAAESKESCSEIRDWVNEKHRVM